MSVDGLDVEFLAAVNAERARHGIASLSPDPILASAAGRWTASMASTGTLVHAATIIGDTPAGTTVAAENVGRGRSVDTLMESFMTSPSHRASLLDPRYTHIGVGVVVSPVDARLYTTHRFAAVADVAPEGVEVGASSVTPQPSTERVVSVPASDPSPTMTDDDIVGAAQVTAAAPQTETHQSEHRTSTGKAALKTSRSLAEIRG